MNGNSIPSEMKLYRVRYEGESYVFAESHEEALKKYRNEAVQALESVISSEKVATYQQEK